MRRVIMLGIIMIFAAVGGCKKDEVISNTSKSQQIIFSENFEFNNQPALQNNWHDNSGKLINPSALVQDAPPNGGKWAINVVTPSWGPQGYAETFITGNEGTHVYTLSFYAKSGDGGTVGFGIIHKPLKYSRIDSTGWALYTLTDTLTTEKDDTIVIRLLAGVSSIDASTNILFDLIKLEISKFK